MSCFNLDQSKILSSGNELKTKIHLIVAYKMLSINPLPDDKILTLSKLKSFADNKINVT